MGTFLAAVFSTVRADLSTSRQKCPPAACELPDRRTPGNAQPLSLGRERWRSPAKKAVAEPLLRWATCSGATILWIGFCCQEGIIHHRLPLKPQPWCKGLALGTSVGEPRTKPLGSEQWLLLRSVFFCREAVAEGILFSH